MRIVKAFLKAAMATAAVTAIMQTVAVPAARAATTFTLFPVAATVAGTPRVSASANYNGRDASVMLQVVSSTWATDDPTITVALDVQMSFDNGVTWSDLCAFSFHPQTFGTRTGALPAVNCTAGDDLGARKVRVVLSVDKSSLTMGINATI